MSTRLPDDLDTRLDDQMAAYAAGLVVRPDADRLVRRLDALEARPAPGRTAPRLAAAAAVALIVGAAGVLASRGRTNPGNLGNDDPQIELVTTTPITTTTLSPATTVAPSTTPPTAAATTVVAPTAAPTTDATAPPTTDAAPPESTEAPAPVEAEPAPPPDAPAPPRPPTTARPTAVAFTASQAFGTCDSDPPYDEFGGKANPGSRIQVSSPYGSGSVTAGDDGHWWVRVNFPNAPVGQPFAVTVSSSQGSRSFSFVRTG